MIFINIKQPVFVSILNICIVDGLANEKCPLIQQHKTGHKNLTACGLKKKEKIIKGFPHPGPDVPYNHWFALEIYS